MGIEERIQPAIAFMPELASLNMGSMNFGLFPMLERFNEFQHSWERDYLESSRDLVFRNTFKDVEYALRTCAGNGTRFEFECYDIGHLYNLAHFLDRGLVQPPLFVQSVFGILGGIGTHPEDVAHMKRTADLHALPNANLAYSVYVVLHETTERITQELIDSRVMGLVRCGCERAVILKDLVRCIVIARDVRDDAGAACVQQRLSRPPRDPSISAIHRVHRFGAFSS
jgi:uncharacterized protein (DUF849 family)